MTERNAEQAGLSLETGSRSLNELMDVLEAELGRLEIGAGERGLQILLLMDAIATRMAQLEAQGSPLQAERAQYAFIVKRVQANAGRILRSVGGARRLAERRQGDPARETRWWWRLDEYRSRQRLMALRRGLTVAGIVAAVLLALALVYQNFLAPDPLVVKIYGLQNSASGFIAQGDYPAALADVEQGLALQPDDVTLLLLKGVALEKLGRQPEANAAYLAAEKASGGREPFLLARASLWLSVGQASAALADAEAVTTLNPASAEGMFYLAKALELVGDTGQALAAYETASRLSEQQGKTELNATIRVNMAMMLQSIQPGLETDEATPQG